MKISNPDGVKRSVVSIRELVAADFVELLSEDYVTEDEPTDYALREALGIYAGEDNGDSLDPGQFVRGDEGSSAEYEIARIHKISAVRLPRKIFFLEDHLQLKYESG